MGWRCWRRRGSALAQPGRQVIARSSDGGLAMLLGELLTVRLHRLPITIVCSTTPRLEWSSWRCSWRVPPRATTLGDVDYADIAAQVGLEAIRITRPGDLRDGLAQALNATRPATGRRRHRSLRPLPAPTHHRPTVCVFATAATKTVLAGGVGKILDVAAPPAQLTSEPDLRRADGDAALRGCSWPGPARSGGGLRCVEEGGHDV